MRQNSQTSVLFVLPYSAKQPAQGFLVRRYRTGVLEKRFLVNKPKENKARVPFFHKDNLKIQV